VKDTLRFDENSSNHVAVAICTQGKIIRQGKIDLKRRHLLQRRSVPKGDGSGFRKMTGTYCRGFHETLIEALPQRSFNVPVTFLSSNRNEEWIQCAWMLI
jgi:hypothetical protein